ncbi:pyridoxal-phosphate dependent enzyme [Salegentibacter sp. LM13S]|uniref:pyridoxal-phosphate dependent enzyme n=1 Tax=Salegentibacter lacus TaxID=2873599 RepID=UPI001CCA9B5F|nr:pyridoxal-phosphate dependent enzyme [Salegentibacter lacus]MBZ9629206.1 pyridoxal-phosphate dependent enzyme [Salegentibacter lacus]
MISKEEFTKLHSEISSYIHRTPVLTSDLLNQIAETEIFFKCENFQKMGAFKMRGATAAILALSDKERAKGVVTHSSGNFAQAVSLSAKSLGIPAYIVMPSSAPQVKKNAVKTYGGQITECVPNLKAREAAAEKIQKETGATFLHPSNDLNVIYGQGTAAKELLEDFPELDVIITPVGGGGLIAGTALAVNFYAENCKTIGAEPFEVDDAYRSLKSGKIEFNETTNTIADGLKTNLGDKNFPIIRDNVSEIIRVEEDEIIAAMKLIWERMKIVVEPSSAVAFAAVLREKEKFRGKKVGIIISGGNVDLSNLPF